jgi:hypothetical protein
MIVGLLRSPGPCQVLMIPTPPAMNQPVLRLGCWELDKSKEGREAIFELFKSGAVHVTILKGQREVQSLVSLQMEDFQTAGKKIAAYAHILALTLQDRENKQDMSNPRESFLFGLLGCWELDKSKEGREAIFTLERPSFNP